MAVGTTWLVGTTVPGDWLRSCLPVTTAMGHPDRAGDRNPRLTPCANTPTSPCLAAFTGQLFNHDLLVLDCSSAGLQHSLGSAGMGKPRAAKERRPPSLLQSPAGAPCAAASPATEAGRLRCCWLLHGVTEPQQLGVTNPACLC